MSEEYSKDRRRRFNRRERFALYVAAGGRCSICGDQLKRGWHADHIRPHVAGGPTNVINGQALCAPCNLKKGSQQSMSNPLRDWQESAILAVTGPDEKNALINATPGSGKTTTALEIAKRRLEQKLVRRIIVVVPGRHLCNQWAIAAKKHYQIDLDNLFMNNYERLADDYHGVVTTYQSVAANPVLWLKLSTQEPTMVIFDEIHHAGEDRGLTWGPAIKLAFEAAERRLMLSGTPWRSDGATIPFVEYGHDGICVADFTYSYADALRDNVVRPVDFMFLDATMSWCDSTGQLEEKNLIDANRKDRFGALRTAYLPTGDFMPSMLRCANDELTRHRGDVPDAAGLVVAAGKPEANAYAKILENLSGEPAVVVHEDIIDAAGEIETFRNSKARWIVAVGMVSEGVDIPRLAVGVLASYASTEMFFQQFVGRFVRMRDDLPAGNPMASLDDRGRVIDETTATVLLPAEAIFRSHAARIEADVVADYRRREKEDDGPDGPTGGGGGGPEWVIPEPVASGEAEHHSTIFGSDSYSPDELRQAEELNIKAGMPRSTTSSMTARLLRMVQPTPYSEPAGPTIRVEPPVPGNTKSEHKKAIRKQIKTAVSRLCYVKGVKVAEQSHINARLNRECGDEINRATVDSLERRLAILKGWSKNGLPSDL
jgi:superfamily II DNA or RNA helicase